MSNIKRQRMKPWTAFSIVGSMFLVFFFVYLAPGIICSVQAEEETLSKPMKLIIKPNVETSQMGGVTVPSAEVLKAMHQGQYILHARGGKLSQIPVEKTLLPHCPKINPQSIQVDLGPEGTVYVRQMTMLCKSTDGGRTWTSQPIGLPEGPWETIHETGRWMVLRDGTFICVALRMGKFHDPAVVFTSKDEGKSWQKVSEIPLDMKMPQTGQPYVERYTNGGLNRLRDETLLWTVNPVSTQDTTGSGRPWREEGLFGFRSTDGGKTWQGPIFMADYGNEGASTMLASGRVFTTVRYQRGPLPTDSPEVLDYIRQQAERGISVLGKRIECFKNVFVMDSEDGGLTWSTPRLLTTVMGQTFGYPAALSDGTVVVIHDTRYGPGPAGSRAMISRDEGKTWEDEVYYLDYTTFTGSYSASVVLEDDTILTIAASSQAGNSWEAVVDHTDLYAIRWRPVKP